MRFLLLALVLVSLGCARSQWRPCVELKRDLRVPCKCSQPSGSKQFLHMDCDRVIFTRENLDILRDQPISSISMRNVGYQKMPEDLLNADLRLEKLDLTDNSINRLMDRHLRAQKFLKELRLGGNLLGDNLNPIFSSNEFRELGKLELLDLHGNGLRGIEEGIFKGCVNLKELYLDDNNLTTVPAHSLKGPRAIITLSLAGNNIGSLPRGAFGNLGESLQRVDLSRNGLAHMEDNALTGSSHLHFFNISRNDLTRLNSDVFKGAFSLQELDLSTNFLQEFPTDALRHLESLDFLNVSNNLITEIKISHLAGLAELRVLDLSRNNIGRVETNAFANLTALTRLDLSLNSLRTIEESLFEGLVNLKWLSLQDNNILLIPASALGRLPSLTHLHVEFNRIAAISNDILRSVAPNLVSLAMTRNLVREIPPRMFVNFKKLVNIELSGNMLSSISPQTFAGLEDTLFNLDLSNNRLVSVAPLALRNLWSLNLASNHLKRLNPETFGNLTRLTDLNISNNPLYGGFPPVFPRSLVTLDASKTGLKILPTPVLLNLASLVKLTLAHNHLQEISEGTFQNLYKLTSIDLSYNAIERIDSGAFVNLTNMYELNLKGNRLNYFAGEFFNTGTGLEIIDLSDNLIGYFSPTSFIIHPRLRELRLSGNRLTMFPREFVISLQYLERIDLSKNLLKKVGELAFSQIGRLRELDLSNNKIESVDDSAFHNSTQLQVLDLSNNVLENLGERTMDGILRLEFLNLRNNELTSLPEKIFDTSTIMSVEKVDLSGNKFHEIPIRPLPRHVLSLSYLNMARNKLVEVFTQEIFNSLKDLDLSQNPLSENAIEGILDEAIILRSLNLAHTGIRSLAKLETPFLKSLNLSGNEISEIRPVVLKRATLLETLDLSNNKLEDLASLASTWKTLPALRALDISGNDPKILNESSFEGLERLRSLKMSSLNATRIEKSTFKFLNNLRALSAYDYPRLGYFDVQGILKDMPNLEMLDIEIKDSSVGNDLLSVKSHPRLRDLTLRGDRLKSILSSALVGIKTTDLNLGFKNSSIDSLPTALFSPIPRSTRVILDISGSNFSKIPLQLLTALDERSGMVKIRGLESNPVNCDCGVKPLWRWLRITENQKIRCTSPKHLAGKYLLDLTEDFLSCEEITSPKIPILETTKSTRSTEPEIIWEVAPTNDENGIKNHIDKGPTILTASTTTDDTLIIGIVGGVVTFIAIIILVICICRLRWGPDVNDACIREPPIMELGSVYSRRMNHEACVAPYPSSTLGHGNSQNGRNTPVQMMPYVQPMHVVYPVHATPPQPIYGYYGDNGQMPMYMCAQDDKFSR